MKNEKFMVWMLRAAEFSLYVIAWGVLSTGLVLVGVQPVVAAVLVFGVICLRRF